MCLRQRASKQLRAHLKAALPEYMVPSAFVTLERMPLTPNGKLDRRALPAPELEAYASRQYEAPQGEVEEILAGIWQALLGLERVGRHDNFFELGGHSLLIVQMMERLRRVGLGAELRRVFDSRDVGGAGGHARWSRAAASRGAAESDTAWMRGDHAADAAAGGAASSEDIERIVQAVAGRGARTFRTSIRWRRCRKAFCSTTCSAPIAAMSMWCRRCCRVASRERLDRADRGIAMRSLIVTTYCARRCCGNSCHDLCRWCIVGRRCRLRR